MKWVMEWTVRATRAPVGEPAVRIPFSFFISGDCWEIITRDHGSGSLTAWKLIIKVYGVRII